MQGYLASIGTEEYNQNFSWDANAAPVLPSETFRTLLRVPIPRSATGKFIKIIIFFLTGNKSPLNKG